MQNYLKSMQKGIFSFSGTNKTWKAIEETRGLVDNLWSMVKPDIKKEEEHDCKRGEREEDCQHCVKN